MSLPPYLVFPVITSDKIILREVSEADLKDILEIQFYDGVAADTMEEGKEMLAKINRNYRDGDSIHWGIADQATNQLVGTLGYYRSFKENTGELGCVLLAQFRGQGFMSRAMELVINYGFSTMQLDRIIAITTTHNAAAVKLLEGLGFFKTRYLEDNEVKFEVKRK
ncbi:MAG: GNAT family N-acetyltransferase [Bacteroidota bacterium]